MQCARPDVGGGPAAFRRPMTLALHIAGEGRFRPLLPIGQHRFGHNAGLSPFQPLIEPALNIADKIHARPRRGNVGKSVPPWADQPFARAAQVLKQAQHGVGIAIGPTADRQHRHGNAAIVLAYRTAAPVVVPLGMLHPARRGRQIHRVEPRQPHGLPAVADDGRIRRRRPGKQGAPYCRLSLSRAPPI